MPKVTIRDVAEAAGVSVSAVSYILNGSTKKKYSEATVKAVRRAAERLSYTPTGKRGWDREFLGAGQRGIRSDASRGGRGRRGLFGFYGDLHGM